MLLLAIRLTHESGNKSILLASLNSLLKILLESDDTNTTSESILIIRCIVRLLLALCRESDEHGVRCVLFYAVAVSIHAIMCNRISLVEQTVGHLRSGKSVSFCSQTATFTPIIQLYEYCKEMPVNWMFRLSRETSPGYGGLHITLLCKLAGNGNMLISRYAIYSSCHHW